MIFPTIFTILLFLGKKLKKKAVRFLMAVTVVSCYFLPFLIFFFAQIAFPKSIGAFVLGVAALSIGSLILYFLMLDQKVAIKEVVKQPAAEAPSSHSKSVAPNIAPTEVTNTIEQESTFIYESSAPILACAKNALLQHPKYAISNDKKIIDEQLQALDSQKNLFTEELEKRNKAISGLQEALERAQLALNTKESETLRQAKELEDLKFELYTLLRIESYVGKENQSEPSSKLATASF